MKLASKRQGSTITITLQHSEKIETLISTLDEMLAHTEVAVNALAASGE